MKVLVLAVSLYLSTQAHADMRHEFVVGVNPIVGYAGATTGGANYWDASNTYAAAYSVNYNMAPMRMLQFGINSSFAYAKTGTASATFFQLLGGPTLNIPFGDEWLHNSLFISAMGGFLMLDTSISSGQTEAALAGDVGYRLKLANAVSWRPSIGVFKVLDGSKFWFVAKPVSFSIIF